MRHLAPLIVLALLAACSKPATHSEQSSQTTSTTTTTKTVVQGSACDLKLVTVADMAGLLPGTATMGPLPGDPQSCKFDSGDSSIIVSLRAGLGDVTVKTVLSGGENVDATPLAGVGDKAAWTPILHEINATKNDVLCDINPAGASVTQQQLGDLCNKIYARMAPAP